MIVRLLAFALAMAAAVLCTEFFLSLLLVGLHFNLQTVLLHRVLPVTAAAVLSRLLSVWWLRRKRDSVAKGEKSLGNSI
jgi:uncharacterized membrane protein